MICLHECWISNLTDLSNIQLPGYDCIAQGKSSSKNGGLIIYVDNRFQYEVQLNINTYECWEGLIIKVTGGGLSKAITIGNISSMVREHIRHFINEFTTVILSIDKSNITINLAGDYNLNLKKNKIAICSVFFDLLTSHSLFPQITLPTRLSRSNGSLIDNIFCKFQSSTSTATSGILINKLSDNLPCFILLELFLFNPPNPKWIKINTQNMKAIQNTINDISASNLYNKLN